MLSISKPTLSKKILPILAMASSAMIFMPQAQAVDIKQNEINKCVNGVVAKDLADNSNAQQLCSCQVNVRSNMTIGQIWEIESYAKSGKDPSQLSYARKMQEDFQQCVDDVELNIPNQSS